MISPIKQSTGYMNIDYKNLPIHHHILPVPQMIHTIIKEALSCNTSY